MSEKKLASSMGKWGTLFVSITATLLVLLMIFLLPACSSPTPTTQALTPVARDYRRGATISPVISPISPSTPAAPITTEPVKQEGELVAAFSEYRSGTLKYSKPRAKQILGYQVLFRNGNDS